MDEYLAAAIEEARQGRRSGGIPVGSVLVIDGEIVARGHNKRVQRGSTVLHAEMDCLENAGRLKASDYRKSVLYSTLSPCDMCSGAVLLYGIPKVVVGENRTFQGPESYLRSRGVKLEIVDIWHFGLSELLRGGALDPAGIGATYAATIEQHLAATALDFRTAVERLAEQTLCTRGFPLGGFVMEPHWPKTSSAGRSQF